MVPMGFLLDATHCKTPWKWNVNLKPTGLCKAGMRTQGKKPAWFMHSHIKMKLSQSLVCLLSDKKHLQKMFYSFVRTLEQVRERCDLITNASLTWGPGGPLGQNDSGREEGCIIWCSRHSSSVSRASSFYMTENIWVNMQPYAACGRNT